ncbi:type II toxin-antitoxin system VapC family toxin [soil metagenome]
MKVLLDTQILIWSFDQTEKLSEGTVEIIKNPENQIFVSVVTFWEIAIKLSLEKLKLPFELSQLVEETLLNNIEILGIEVNHIIKVASLPFHHRDPFDRLIISQGITGNFSIITSDDKFALYNITRIW